jgi:hypothetical protein
LHLRALWNAPERAQDIAPLMLWGAPGVGKSTVLRELAARLGIGFIDMRLAQRDPVDLRGLPVPRDEAVHWLLPAEWPRAQDSRGILLFDELTAADRTLQVAAYEIILDRRLGDLYTLPPGWYVAAAGNRASDRAVAMPMSSALANRFCHVELAPDAEGWTAWALRRSLRPEVVGFIRYRPDCLLALGGEVERGWPSPRAWERVSHELDLLEQSRLPPPMRERLLRLAVAGLVGEGTAIEFLAFRDLQEGLPDPLGMLEGRVPVSVPKRADQRYALCAAISYHLRRRADWLDLAATFLRIGLALPSDFAALAMADALRDRPAEEIAAFHRQPAFAAWSRRHGAALASGVGAAASEIAASALADDILAEVE